MVKASSKLVILLVTVVIALVLASPAFALTTSATTTRDMDHPGMMKRVIFSECQVAQYPVNVTHAGYIHAELNFNSGWDSNYLSVFIWDERNFEFQNINQGWYLIGTGKAVVDYNVQSISTEGKVLVDEDAEPNSGDEYLVGDNYWIIVVVSNDWNSKFNVTGYSPQIDLAAGYGANTQNENNFYLQKFNLPGKDVKQRLIGVPYGNPFDFKPTSEGSLTTDLTYPANAKEKTVSDDLKNGNAPAIWEQYVYAGGDWDTVIANYFTSSPSWWPNMYGTAPDNWWGLSDTINVNDSDSIAKPNKVYHYCADLVLVAGDYTQGPFAPLDPGKNKGISTMGYRSTLSYPCNLWITSAPSTVKKGATATIKGNFALNGAWVPEGTEVKLMFSGNDGASWTTNKTIETVGAMGEWTAKVKCNKSGKWKALAIGDDATGLPMESSLNRTINVN